MNLKNLDRLKQKVAKAPNLADAYEYFLDRFGDRPEFMDVGARTENEVVEKFVEAIGQELFGPRAKVSGMILVRIAEHNFIHGAGTLSGRMANVIYFDDIEVGMVAIVPGVAGKGTQFARFSARKLPEGYIGSDN